MKTDAIIANPQVHTKDELANAKRRFRELYVAEMSMVEVNGVEQKMIDFALEVDPALLELRERQKPALNLAHALRDSFVMQLMAK